MWERIIFFFTDKRLTWDGRYGMKTAFSAVDLHQNAAFRQSKHRMALLGFSLWTDRPVAGGLHSAFRPTCIALMIPYRFVQLPSSKMSRT